MVHLLVLIFFIVIFVIDFDFFSKGILKLFVKTQLHHNMLFPAFCIEYQKVLGSL